MCQRLMRCGEPLEHFEILAAAEPFAKPLRLLGPHPAEARPERLDQFHLVAVNDHETAQLVALLEVAVRAGEIQVADPERAAEAIGAGLDSLMAKLDATPAAA